MLAATKQGATEAHEVLTAEQLQLERLFLGFRNREGVDLKDISPDSSGRAALKTLVSKRLVRRHGEKIIPSVKGYLLADSLPLLVSS